MGSPKGSKNGTHVEKVPLQFDPAESVEEIAKELIPKYHSWLACAEIAYLFCNKEITKSGKKVVATAEKTSKKVKTLCGKDFVLTVSYPIWNDLERNIKLAVVDHELMHMLIDDDDQGNQKCSIIPHDYEEFHAIIKRHGLYRGELELMGNMVKELGKKEDEVSVEKEDDLFDE